MPALLTVHEAAELLRLSDAAVYSLCEASLLPHRRPSEGEGAIRIDRADVQTFIARLEAAVPSDFGLCQVPPADTGDAKGNPAGEATAAPTTHTDPLSERFDSLAERLGRIEAMLADMVRMRTAKEWYSTAEVAELMGRAEFTVREWCRLRRIHAEKRRTGRGRSQEWKISHEEVERLRNEGLLPEPKCAPRPR